jgi:hypothetical protein
VLGTEDVGESRVGLLAARQRVQKLIQSLIGRDGGDDFSLFDGAEFGQFLIGFLLVGKLGRGPYAFALEL